MLLNESSNISLQRTGLLWYSRSFLPDSTFRHVWNSMSITFVRYQTLLLDSLYHLICSCVRFLGTDVSAEFCLVLLEASYHSNNHIVSNTIKSYLRGLWRDIPTVQWLEMQSVFIQVRNLWLRSFSQLCILIPSRDLWKIFRSWIH